jgi:hypothetical protein
MNRKDFLKPGTLVIVREALIDGDLSDNSLQSFWH